MIRQLAEQRYRVLSLFPRLDPAGTLSMYDYDLNQILSELIFAGIRRFTVQAVNHSGHHAVVILGRKG